MALKYLVPIDLNLNELQNWLIHKLGTDPGSPVEGQGWYNTTTHLFKWYNGTAVIDPLSRANHTGSPSADWSNGSHKITNVTDPSSAQDAATKAYVDAAIIGVTDWKLSVRAATTANITLSGAQTIDGVSVIAGDRVLVKDQGTGANNGLYVAAAGAWARAADADTSAEVTTGLAVWVEEGTANGSNGFILTTANPITLGTTALTFTQFSGTGQITAGAGLTKTGNTLDAVGTANRITVAADSIDIAATYVGQSSITTLGTITTGVWTGTAIAVANGGTGATAAAAARVNLNTPGIYSTTVGDGAATSYTITHNLNTRNVIWQLYTTASTYDDVICNGQRTTVNTLTLTFTTAPTSGQYTVVVMGQG